MFRAFGVPVFDADARCTPARSGRRGGGPGRRGVPRLPGRLAAASTARLLGQAVLGQPLRCGGSRRSSIRWSAPPRAASCAGPAAPGADSSCSTSRSCSRPAASGRVDAVAVVSAEPDAAGAARPAPAGHDGGQAAGDPRPAAAGRGEAQARRLRHPDRATTAACWPRRSARSSPTCAAARRGRGRRPGCGGSADQRRVERDLGVRTWRPAAGLGLAVEARRTSACWSPSRAGWPTQAGGDESVGDLEESPDRGVERDRGGRSPRSAAAAVEAGLARALAGIEAMIWSPASGVPPIGASGFGPARRLTGWRSRSEAVRPAPRRAASVEAARPGRCMGVLLPCAGPSRSAN